ncbi:DUF892 family protein [Sphingosinithalassobacter sp. LHW66-3]|uniref:DUF892 family protein n=1 Tax=Sphingosinithalassobacter sp. LHW66-3 TaxID=3424718 RepID=UPI003D6A6259
MADTETAAALLTLCLQDLRAGEEMLAVRLPGIAAAASAPALLAQLAEEAGDAAAHVRELEATGRAAGGPDNIWMKGILDDAERDTRSIAKGALLDTAMIGAVRKAKAAKLVSYETAIALAGQLDEPELRRLVERLRNVERSGDAWLAELLGPSVERTSRI